jgi:ABC-type multidrug transport system fused ATPase/permease subunit
LSGSAFAGTLRQHDHRDIQAFVTYVTSMLWPIQDLARVFAEMQHAIASAERIFSLVDAVPEIKDRDSALIPAPSAAISRLKTLPSPIRMAMANRYSKISIYSSNGAKRLPWLARPAAENLR